MFILYIVSIKNWILFKIFDSKAIDLKSNQQVLILYEKYMSEIIGRKLLWELHQLIACHVVNQIYLKELI